MRRLTLEIIIEEITKSVLISVIVKRAVQWGQAEKFSPTSSACIGVQMWLTKCLSQCNHVDCSAYVDQTGDVI